MVKEGETVLFVPVMHKYIKCPKGCCDGNDDKIVDQDFFVGYGGLEVHDVKQCDICGCCYEVVTKYKIIEQFQQ